MQQIGTLTCWGLNIAELQCCSSKSLLSLGLCLKRMWLARHTGMFSKFYSVLLLNSGRAELGDGVTVGTNLLQDHSLAWFCCEGALGHPGKAPCSWVQHRLRKQLSSAHGPPELREISFDTAATEVCKECLSVCREALAKSSSCFSLCRHGGLKLWFLSLCFGVQILI